MTKITVNINSKGKSWPDEMQELKDWLRANGWTIVAEGSGGKATDGPRDLWWAISFEREAE